MTEQEMPQVGGNIEIHERRIIIRMSEALCNTPEGLVESVAAAKVVRKFIHHLVIQDSPLLCVLGGIGPESDKSDVNEATERVLTLLRQLIRMPLEIVARAYPELMPMCSDPQNLAQFVESLYDFWRGHERYLIFEGGAMASRDRAREGHYLFINANKRLKEVVLSAYRQIEAHIRGYWPRVYRQVPSGANMSLLVDSIPWQVPSETYEFLREIKTVRLALLEPPVVLYPKRNTRKGKFLPVLENPITGITLNPSHWLCLPLKVGPLMIQVFFHQDYMSLAVSLVNLFEMAGHEEARRKPDGVLVFGVPADSLGENQTVFYEDTDADVVVGAVGRSEDVDYFGYFKKMVLTIHNVIMMRRGRLPVHGAMARIELKDRRAANVVIIGDSGAGKSESLEAFRALAGDHLRQMIIVFDDMGSLDISKEEKVIGYGTEIGAFVRLDDLQPGFAFGQIDRSILMNPHKTNARLVLPITPYNEIMAGYPVDLVLYANNYEQVDEDHPFVQIIETPEHALHVFREGYRAAKGTTDEKGLVHTYFANPFGPSQLKERHDPLAERYFRAMFKAGIKVGQLRTRLGIPGFEQEGPESAAKALFEFIRENC